MTGRLGGGLSVWSCCSSNMLLAAKKKHLHGYYGFKKIKNGNIMFLLAHELWWVPEKIAFPPTNLWGSGMQNESD